MKSIRVLAYAINGRGMGHLTRQLAILRWIRRLGATMNVRVEAWVLTSSEADTLARREGFPSIKIPSKSMMRDAGLEPARYLAIARGWVLNAVATLQPDVLVVDTFPAGSFGELAAALELVPRRALVRRAMKAAAEKEAGLDALLPMYHHVSVPDEDRSPILLRERPELLDRAEARRALGLHDGARAVWLALGGGGDPTTSSQLPRLVERVVAAGWHAVVAAGPLYQGPERRGPGITWLDRYAAMELLPGVDAAVSAGGYNSVHELRFAGVPTVWLPQEKLADDQAARVAAWGRVAATLDEVPGLLAQLPPRSEPTLQNGARHAAAGILGLVLDPADVAAALATWDDATLGALQRAGLEGAKADALLRLFAGDRPGAVAQRRAVLAELRDRGVSVAAPRAHTSASVARFVDLCAEVEAPMTLALPVAEALSRRFPAATPAELLAACEALFVRFAEWHDWMGALALARCLPTQREYPLAAAAPTLVAWLGTVDDPYAAVKRLSTLEANGARPLAEVLRMDGP